MTNPNPPARLFRLTSWERLESLAAQHGAIAKSGPNAGKPSVHTMLAAIEAGVYPLNPTGWKCAPGYCEYWTRCRGRAG